MDKSGYSADDRVYLLQLDDEFLGDLPEDDVKELTSLIGREWTVVAWREETQHIEIECWVERSEDTARSHTVWVPLHWIERVD